MEVFLFAIFIQEKVEVKNEFEGKAEDVESQQGESVLVVEPCKDVNQDGHQYSAGFNL